jgi:hypothetical protein
MNLAGMLDAMKCEVKVGAAEGCEVTGCYVSDLLSDVLSGSRGGELWVTQHTHANVVAVAAVKELAAVLVVSGKPISEETLARARAEGVTMLSTRLSAFEVAGIVYGLLKAAGAAEGA